MCVMGVQFPTLICCDILLHFLMSINLLLVPSIGNPYVLYICNVARELGIYYFSHIMPKS